MPSPPANARRGARAAAAPEAKRHEVAGLLALSTSILLGLSLASFDARGGADWVGPVGARLAEGAIALLGTAAVLVPWVLLVLAVNLFRRTVAPLRLSRTLGTGAILVTVATALHLWFGERPALGGLIAGGLVGSSLGEGLRALVGTVGAHTVVLTGLLVALVVRTRLSVVSVAEGARTVGAQGGTMLRSGMTTMAKAWRSARQEELRGRTRPGATAPGTSRRTRSEELTDEALKPVLEAQPPWNEDEPGDDEEPEPGRSRSLVEALMLADDLPSPATASATARAATPEPLPEPVAPAAKPRGRKKSTTPEPAAAPEPTPTPVVVQRTETLIAPAVITGPRVDDLAMRTVVEAPVVEMPVVEAPVEVAPPKPARSRAKPASMDVVPMVAPVVHREVAPEPEPELPARMFSAPAMFESAESIDDESEDLDVEEPEPVVLPPPRRIAKPAVARAVAPKPAPVFEPEPELDDEPDEIIEPVRAREVVEPVRAREVIEPVRAREVIAPEPDEVVEAEAPSVDEPLPIVSHEREIARAMQVPRGHVASEPSSQRSFGPMELPSSDLLSQPPTARSGLDESQLRATADKLIKTLNDYTIDGRVMEIHPGPVVTTYEVLPAAGTKLSKIVRLSDDIAMSLEASKVRIVAPIPGKGRVGFEIPNTVRQTVYFRELIETEAFRSLGGALPVALGKDVVGAPYYADLAKMPHLIVAGATGAGKSVGLNVMLTSLLYKRGPEDVRLLMVDPKMVELAVYDGIPHMLLPVVTDMKKATLALRWVVDEMERRYSLFAQTGSRNIESYNEKVVKAIEEGRTIKGLDGPVRTKETGTTVEVTEGVEAPPASAQPKKLPYILCVVDEFADLIMVAGKDIEAAVARLAQKARAAGIHVILATQRPSVDVITGMIKANFPSRIAFKVSQKVDSRTILDQQGAEHLLGRGDMLILPPGASDLRRVHCAFVSEDEVQKVTDHWRTQGKPTYDEDILKPRDEDENASDEGPAEIKVPQEKYERAVNLVMTQRKCSVSFVQRYLGIGYNVAARIVDKMEREGIVGAPKGPGKEREVLG